MENRMSTTTEAEYHDQGLEHIGAILARVLRHRARRMDGCATVRASASPGGYSSPSPSIWRPARSVLRPQRSPMSDTRQQRVGGRAGTREERSERVRTYWAGRREQKRAAKTHQHYVDREAAGQLFLFTPDPEPGLSTQELQDEVFN